MPNSCARLWPSVLPADCILLVPHAHFGVDLSPGLSVKMNAAYVLGRGGDRWRRRAVPQAGAPGVRRAGEHACALRHLLGRGAQHPPGRIPGAGKRAGGRARWWISRPRPANWRRGGGIWRRSVAETGDVDITKQPVLVSVGRGIQEKENVAIAEELAEAMGGAVSCSRPVVDAKWMDKSRQVGSSGQTVKPKVYLACGISGSFQHLAGIKGNPFIVAINKNPEGADLPRGGRGNRRRHPGVPAGLTDRSRESVSRKGASA